MSDMEQKAESIIKHLSNDVVRVRLAEYLNRQKARAEKDARQDDGAARAFLEQKGMTEAQVESLLSHFATPHGPRILTDYNIIHNLPLIDQAFAQTDMGNDYAAGGIKAIFQCVELCLYGLENLATRAARDLRASGEGQDNFAGAREKILWLNSVNETLLALSQLPLQLRRDVVMDRAVLGLNDSPYLGAALDAIEGLHRSIIESGCAESEIIRDHGLGNSQRAVSFSAVVDDCYRNIWKANLDQTFIPKLPALDGLDSRQAYEALIAPNLMREAIDTLDLKHDSYVLQFHIYHQVSELLAKAASYFVIRAIGRLTAEDAQERTKLGNLAATVEDLHNAAVLTSLIPANVIPILKNLSQKDYHVDIRPFHGIASGATSPYLSQGITGPLRTMLLSAVNNFAAGADVYSVDDLKQSMAGIVADRNNDYGSHLRYTLCQDTLRIANVAKDWRELHTGFLVQQFGLAENEASGVRSLSGLKTPTKAAHDMSRLNHTETDLAAPMFEALIGVPYRPIPHSTQRFSPENLGEIARILNNGAVAVRGVTDDYQRRGLLAARI
jgi:hypothetical protein